MIVVPLAGGRSFFCCKKPAAFHRYGDDRSHIVVRFLIGGCYETQVILHVARRAQRQSHVR